MCCGTRISLFSSCELSRLRVKVVVMETPAKVVGLVFHHAEVMAHFVLSIGCAKYFPSYWL